jgi:carbon storage regulator
MLVLTRRKGERLLIGDDIEITVIEVKGDGVRIGVEAPKGIRILRQEVVAAVSEANVAAAQSGPDAAATLASLLAPLAPSVPPVSAPPAE